MLLCESKIISAEGGTPPQARHPNQARL